MKALRSRCARIVSLVALCAVPATRPLAGSSQETEMTALDPDAVPLEALPLGDAPGATTVISEQEIARSGAANIFELLRRVPGVDIRYTPMGGHIGIRSNGSSPFSEQVLMLIDGSPYNSPDKGGFPGHPNYVGFFPLTRIARIEIIKGPISVVYGANAFGGVINIVSKKAADAVTRGIEGAAYGATLAVGNRNILERRIRGAWVHDGWESSLELGVSAGDTPIQLNGDAEHRRADLYGAIRRGNFSASYLHQENRNGSFPFLTTQTQTAYHNVDILDAHYERRIGESVLRASASVNRYRGTTCAVCHNNQSGAPDDRFTSDVGDERETDQRLYASVRMDRTLCDSQDLNVGLVTAHDTVDRDIVAIDGAPKSLDSTGAFVQHQLHLRQGTVHVLSGVRGDAAEGLGAVASPRVALVVAPSDDVTVRASWSRAYRAPSWNERFIRQRFFPEGSPGSPIVVFYGNPDLERERNDSTAAGVSWRALPNVVLKGDLYENRIHDFIYRNAVEVVPGSPTELRYPYENDPVPFTVRGGEISLLTRRRSALAVDFGYAYRETNLDASDPKAAYTPRHRVMLNASWLPTARITFDVAGSWSDAFNVSLPQIFGVRPQPSYEIVDASVRYAFPLGRSRISVGLIGRNLLDEHPYETLVDSEIDTALRGRTVAAELRVDF